MDFKVYPGCLEREAQQAARYGAGRSPAPYRLPTVTVNPARTVSRERVNSYTQ